MARFIMANRRAGKFHDRDKAEARASVAATLRTLPGIDIVADNDPGDPTARRVVVFEADPAEMGARQAALPPDTIIEPEILHWPAANPPPSFLPPISPPPGPSPARRSAESLFRAAAGRFDLAATGGGAPLAGAAATLYLSGPDGMREAAGVTDGDGRLSLPLEPGLVPAALVVQPVHGYWVILRRDPVSGAVVECPPLPRDGPLAWWHRLLGIDVPDDAHAPSSGAGITVGVVDTGIGPHGGLAHAAGIGAFLGGGFEAGAQAAADADRHGTHVAGTIGARPRHPGDHAGIAPGCTLVAARVFASADAGANQGDIANAIDALSRDHGADLINLSLGAARGSLIERDAIQDALERGTLCICAAGNDGGPVNYPAAFPETVAVSALGLAGTAPPGSMSADRRSSRPEDAGRDGLFLANFSSRGEAVTCAAPGVGIIAPVPGAAGGGRDAYAVMDGTSMASPAACAALAVLLGRDAAYRALPRDIRRAEAARAVLLGALRDAGLGPYLQGGGIPYAGGGIV